MGDEEEAEETGSNYSDEEDEENQSANIPKNHPVEIHSYSVIKIKREPGTFKKTTSRTPATRTKQSSGGRKYKVNNSISQKKRKLYEMEPLGDPIAEKNRLNASTRRRTGTVRSSSWWRRSRRSRDFGRRTMSFGRRRRRSETNWSQLRESSPSFAA